jgi:hypothetical protein
VKALIIKFVWPAYLAALIFFGYAGIDSYLNATSILKDHTAVNAPVELVDTTYRTKKGHTTTTYVFNYSYEVGGNEYSSEYSAVNEKGERYLDEGFITVAYSNADPTRVDSLQLLERQSSLGGWIKRMLIVAAILGLIAFFVYGWALPDEDDDALPEGERA